MVLANELLDRCEGKISSLKQDLPELKPKDFAIRLHQILENFQEMRESLQSVHQLFDGLDLEGISSQELLQWLFKKSQGSKEESELMDAASSNDGLELSVQQANYEYQGVLLPTRIKQMETIWEWLNNDRVGTIGITGESGMGKTWMVMQLKDRAITAKLFDIVIVLDMNRKEVLEAQQYIVDQLGLSITKEPDDKYYIEKDFNRAVNLSLGKKKCLLILHGITFYPDLSKLGFSEPWKQNVSSKVLISGPTDVMYSVEKDKICQVEPLDDHEALLFLEKTGLVIDFIWEWLNNGRVGTIGITGKHRMGMTWMVRQLKDRAITAKLFDIVIMLDMSRTSFFSEAQQYIVDQLGLSIPKNPDGTYNEKDLKRAVTLSLGTKKCLLIINDIKYNILGFIEPLEQNASFKMLISGPTRITHAMETDKICRVEPVDDDEALLLFLGKTGLDIDSPHVIEVARPLVASLGLKIDSPRVNVWLGGDAAELTNRVCHLLNSGKMEVIQCLQSCCYPSSIGECIKVKDLIAWWIMEILVDDCLGLAEAYEKAQHILQELIDRQFLELNETHVQLRSDLVGHLNLDSFISSIIPHREFKMKRSCMMNEKFKSKDSDDDDRATELLLMYGKESYLPRYIPADFFIHKMQNLNTLAIFNAGIVSLPESLSNLKHLELLIIKGCTSLENLDSIRGLQKLKRLCISGASRLREITNDIFENIGELVELDLSNTQLKNLGNIKNLILRGCSRLESIPIPSRKAFRVLSVLDLSGASALTSIPDILYSSLKTLDLSRTLIETLPSLSNLESLVQLFLRGCTKITTMQHPYEYKSLADVDLSGATSFREFQGGEEMSGNILSKIDLSGTQIAQEPRFAIGGKITELLLRNCVHLETMAHNPYLFIELEVLDLSGSIALKKISDISYSYRLRKLDLSRTQIGKLPVLSMHSSIVHLILRECGLLEELPHLELQRLQVLDLSGSTRFKTFKDHSFDMLPKLKTLNLSETQVANLPTLSHCTELRHLIMRKCLKLEELPHLNTLEKLELLDLSGVISFKQFIDESFGKKEELHELNLSETQVAHIPSLSECYNLRKLLLGGCSKLEILSNMEVLSSLVVLDLSGISLFKFHVQSTGLKYDYLQELDLSGNEISDLEFISECIALCRLSLKDCPNILTMPPLDELTRLEELDLSRTEITDLSFLSGCKNLRQLLLNDCLNIQELTSLKDHTRLEVLDLSGTKVEDFSLLSGFNKLRKLSIRGCLNLDTLPFEGLHNLQEVDLSYNPIKVLPSSFSELQNIQKLLLADCSSLKTLPHMEFLPKLEVLDLSCTYVREFPNDISALTHLRFLKLQEENSTWKFHTGKSFEKFHFCLFAPKERIGENDIYLQGQQYSFKDIYYQTSHILSIAEEPDKFFKICGFQTFPAGIEEVLLQVELLYLKKNNFLTRLSDLGAENVKNMRECWIDNCDSMETVFYGEEVDENVALGRCLQNLWVSKLSDLKSLFGGVVQPGCFTSLKHLYIECCPSLITIFSSHLELRNLEVLKIKFCDKVEGIYGETVMGENTLPSLKTMILFKLPELQSICGGVLRSIRSLRVIGCKKLKKLPVCGNKIGPPVKVKGEVVWWNDLEWEDKDTKSQLHFTPF